MQMDNNIYLSQIKDNEVILVNDYYFFMCPHCHVYISVHKKELNCKIFRCGQFKSNNQPIPPHASKEQCDEYVLKNIIDGCGKPFIFKDTHIEKCDYI